MDNNTYKTNASVQSPLYKLSEIYHSMIIYQVFVSV